ncbi:mannitol-1-phosphate 5-dehydrogenase [Cohnella sp. GCM10012308]|uniref:mannitol-1-phosphate 5-dehydrogenase n=1 Tax=Cohnella sp. GCM10012308 TaxID=3317329 RepID=UPI00362055D4
MHFGAGNIGRGFIGMQLSKSGYEVCFVARNETQIARLKQQQQYTVTYADESEQTEVVRNVTAVHIKNGEEVKRRILNADILTTAVGAASLPAIAATIAAGLELRLATHSHPLYIIACENAVRGSTQLKKHIYEKLSAEGRARADRSVIFPDSMIDRIVPAQPSDDPLAIKVEPFYEWIIDRHPLRPDFRRIRGAIFADKLEPYMARKLYTVNTGHCVAAYLGHRSGCRTLQEVLRSAPLRLLVRQTLEETGELLVRKYGLDRDEHRLYIDKTLERFANPAIVDDVTRVARSPLRKLSRGERIVRPLLEAHELGLAVPHLTAAAAAGILYRYAGDPESVQLQDALRENGLSAFIAQHMGIPARHALHAELIAAVGELRTQSASRLNSASDASSAHS